MAEDAETWYRSEARQALERSALRAFSEARSRRPGGEKATPDEATAANMAREAT